MKPSIVYATDDKFAEILGVSLVSLYENNQDMEDIFVYILDGGIAKENQERIASICHRYKRSNPVWITAKNICEELSMNVVTDRGSLTQYARLFISSDLPNELERVLYLDCDTIINQSIRELWNLDMHGKTLAALMDAFSKAYRRNINLQPEDVMFNSGVMLIDLKRWRGRGIEDRLLKFIGEKKGKIQQGDQGALNGVLSHDTYCFEPRFNSVSLFFDFTYEDMLIYRKPPEFYSKGQVKAAVDNPVIIHFTTSFLSKRAWMKGCQHKYAGKWIEYKEKSPWKDTELWDDKRSRWLLNIYKKMPGRLALRIAGFLQAYGRPWKNRLKKYN